MKRFGNASAWRMVVALAMFAAAPAHAQLLPGKVDPDGYDLDKIHQAFPEYFRPIGNDRTRPADLPDVFGPGSVLTAGNLYMKVTNFGHVGNFFTNLSNDP